MQLKKNILNSTQDELDLLGIRRTRIMRVDLLRRRALVERHEAVEQVRARRVVVVAAGVVREVVAQWRLWELLREQVDLVQEKDL